MLPAKVAVAEGAVAGYPLGSISALLEGALDFSRRHFGSGVVVQWRGGSDSDRFLISKVGAKSEIGGSRRVDMKEDCGR